MENLANSFGDLAGGGDIGNWLLPVLIIGGMILGLRMKSMVRRNMQASSDRSMELSSRLASVDVEALLHNPEGSSAPQPQKADTDAFFSNAARKTELAQSASETVGDAPVTADTHELAAPAPLADDAEPIFEIPTLQDLPRRAPNEPVVSEDAARRVAARLMEVDAKRKADPTYKPSRAEQVARYAVTAQRRDGGSAVYLKKGANVGDIRRYKKAAEILGANDLAYILEHSADLVDAAQQADNQGLWDAYAESADQLSELFRIANETDRSTGRLVSLADAYLAQNS